MNTPKETVTWWDIADNMASIAVGLATIALAFYAGYAGITTIIPVPILVFAGVAAISGIAAVVIYVVATLMTSYVIKGIRRIVTGKST